eukprot:CAMPEP_0172589130 /NCGR_PEP_ID=MMETSP1068-20121228/7934_1 /TAXON_ID=35684 /ORGANISM="Pseudopedinella elastica, Strain CCMP716" /LENGTH=140 /DNA_ID=CAMNT_0013384661 /DNA_START=370 /DNA_END=792 /DNA_ORIENTATION=+
MGRKVEGEDKEADLIIEVLHDKKLLREKPVTNQGRWRPIMKRRACTCAPEREQHQPRFSKEGARQLKRQARASTRTEGPGACYKRGAGVKTCRESSCARRGCQRAEENRASSTRKGWQCAAALIRRMHGLPMTYFGFPMS